MILVKYKHIKLPAIIIMAIALYLSAPFAHGQAPNPNDPPNNKGIENPLGNTKTITAILVNLTQWLLGLIAIIALIALIIGGVRMILAFGREEALKDAKKIVTWAIIGLVVAILSYMIIRIVASEILQAPGIN